MAPCTADPTRSTQSKANRPTPVVPRIVPAIPLAFSRAPRAKGPITPEHTATSPAGAPPEEIEAPTDGEKLSEEQPPADPQAPFTPESRASALNPDESAENTPGSSSSRVSGVNDGDTEITRGQ